jgi:hypothetical protein
METQDMSKDRVLVRVNSGNAHRMNEIVSIHAKPNQWFHDWQEGKSGLAVSKLDEGGEVLENITCQFEPKSRQLSWLTGDLQKGESALYGINAVDSQEDISKRYSIEQKPAHLLINADGTLFARYNYMGVWKPYFWPVNGSGGSVVRGAGGGDHPHHTGLYLAYGGHGEGGSANIWSDWDEPPYGPCGKMLHQRFIYFSEGPVYAEFVEDIIYVKGNGDVLLDERRTARAWYSDNGARFLDLSFDTTTPLDIGERQFLLVARITPSMKLPEQGHVENSEGDIGRKEVHHKRARWCDLSGTVGDGVNGICIFDHPNNPEYPGFWGEIAVPSQMTLLHHPPKELSEERLHLKFRIYIHDGMTADAQVETRYQSYISPAEVELSG